VIFRPFFSSHSYSILENTHHYLTNQETRDLKKSNFNMGASTVAQKVASVLPTLLPPYQNTGALSNDQLNTFMAFADAVIPGFVPDGAKATPNQLTIPATEFAAEVADLKRIVGASEEDAVKAMLAESASSYPEFRSALERCFNVYAAEDVKQNVGVLMTVLK
jgi:hypothetical protein